jgi:Fe-S cluster biogenesis protein NfuA
MNTATNSPVMLYTEQTPNPDSLKFVTNRILYRGIAEFRDAEFAQTWSPLAILLFEQPFVQNVYITNNYVTITKSAGEDWADIMLNLKELIKNHIETEGVIIKDGFEDEMRRIEAENEELQFTGEDGETARRIKDLIDTYVKPAVEMDGGNIEFKRYDKGTVYVMMQGSCSGCPSATVTLKAGIEGMLKRMVPEVQDVVQEMC